MTVGASNLLGSKYLRAAKLILGLAVFFSFLYIVWVMVDPDLGWHLKVGEWILEHKAVPRADIYSYTMPGFEWVAHEWLVDAWLWWMQAHGMWWIVVIVFALVSFTPFLIWFIRAKTFLALWLVALVATATTNFLGIRPQIISFALFFALYEILARYYGAWSNRPVRKTHWHLLLPLPFIFLVWANVHAGFLSGLVLFGLFWAVFHLARWWRNGEIRWHNFITEGLVLLVSIAFTFANPYTWKLYHLIFSALFSYETHKYIAEWQPALAAGDWSHQVPLILFISAFLFLAAKFYKNYPLHFLGAAALFFALAMKSVRMLPLFFVTAWPILTQGEALAEAEIRAASQASPPQPKIVRMIKIFALAVCLATLAVWVYPFFNSKNSLTYPSGAVDFLRAQKPREIGRMLNDYGWGGYLIQNLSEVKVFIDGRMPHWVGTDGNSAMRDYIKVFYGGKDEWREVFSRRNISTVLIGNTAYPSSDGWFKRHLPKKWQEFLRESAAIKWLTNRLETKKKPGLKSVLLENGWSVAYQDNVAVVLRCDQRCW